MTSDDAPPADRTAELPLASETAAYRALFANRGFRRLFVAMAASSLGDWIGLFAILALTDAILGGGSRAAFGLSGVMVARLLPTLVFGPVAGVYVDRWDRKRTMIATDIGRFAVMAAVPFVEDYFQLFVATLFVELLAMLFAPAKDATLPNLVARSRLVQANQMSLIVTYGTLPLGGVLVAVLTGLSTTVFSGIDFLAETPVALAIWVNAATFLFSAAAVAGIDMPRDDEPRRAASVEQPGAWVELSEGFRFIATQPMVRALVVGVMGAFLGAGIVVAIGELFADVVNAGDSGFGVLVAAAGIGLLLGLVVAVPLSRRLAKERLFAPGIATGGIGLIVTAFMPRLDLAAIPAFVMGLGAGLAFVTGYTLLQEGANDELRGRTFASFNTGVRAALFLSTVVAPLLAGFIGIESAGRDGVYGYAIGGTRITLIIGGVVAIVGAVWSGSQIHKALTSSAGIALPGTAIATGHGLFVAFEGGEGSGKSTQLRLLHRALEREGHDVLVTREPGGTRVGERIRELVLHPEHHDMHDRTEALLYAAARTQHVHRVIRPALDKGVVVLSDRYVDSSIAYQGVGRGLGEEAIEELNRWGTQDLVPDLVILLDIDAAEGLRRARRSTTAPLAGLEPPEVDRLEAAGLAFHRAVNEAFRRRAAAAEDRYLVLDSRRPVEELAASIREVVLELVRVPDEDEVAGV